MVKISYLIGFCLALCLQAVQVSAQSLDVEPPVVEHNVIDSNAAASRQDFFATVADDDELASIRFLYRFEGEKEFTTVEMTRVSFSSTYSAQIATDIDDRRAIEYYIEARDASGNRTFRGYAFDPLVRLIELAEPAIAAAAPEEPKVTSKNRTLYYIVGALLLGAIAGGVANSGDGGSSSGGNCSSDGCLVGIDATPVNTP